MGAVSDRYHDVADYLDAHPILKKWVVPVVFMAGILLLLFVAFDVTGLESVQLVAVYLAFSAVAVVFGLGVERVLDATLG